MIIRKISFCTAEDRCYNLKYLLYYLDLCRLTIPCNCSGNHFAVCSQLRNYSGFLQALSRRLHFRKDSLLELGSADQIHPNQYPIFSARRDCISRPRPNCQNKEGAVLSFPLKPDGAGWARCRRCFLMKTVLSVERWLLNQSF